MRCKPLVKLAVVVGLSFSTARAAPPTPPPPNFRPCQQSLLAGNWEFHGVETNSVCSITIAPNGWFTTQGSCVDDNFHLAFHVYVDQPAGALNIDAKCHVTGTISYSIRPLDGCVTSYRNTTISLWLSADGSTASGYGTGTYSFSGGPTCSGSAPFVSEIDLFFRTEGQ
jgi:hypothetical protein